MIKKIILIILVFITVTINAANYGSIKVTAKVAPTGITLRWAPDNAALWLMLNTEGYKIERYTIAYKNKTLDKPQYKLLTKSALLPFSKNTIELIVKKDTNQWLMVAAETLYGDREGADSVGASLGQLLKRATDNMNKHGFALMAADRDTLAAKMLALLFVDTDIEKNYVYKYAISPFTNSTAVNTDTAFVTIANSKEHELPQISNIQSHTDNKSIWLTWPAGENAQYYSGYYIHKSSDNGKTFRQLNKIPFLTTVPQGLPINHVYTDTGLVNGQLYIYKVCGISSFAEIGPLSKPIEVRPLPNLVAPVIINTEITNSKIVVNWQYPDSLLEFTRGFNVFLAHSVDGESVALNKSLLKPVSRSFTIQQPLLSNYITIRVYRTFDTVYSTSALAVVQITDSIPPVQPTGLAAFADSLGLLHVKWNKNTEPDLLGYRLFMAYNPLDEYLQPNQYIIDTNALNIQLPTNSLEKTLYLKVLAADFRYNYSQPTNVHRLVLRNNIPLPKPIVTIENAENNTANICMVSDYTSATDYFILYRALLANATWFEAIDSVKNALNVKVCIINTLPNNQTACYYKVVAADSSGKQTMADIVYFESKQQVLLEVKASKSYNPNNIVVTWNIPPNAEKGFLWVATNNNAPTQVAVINSTNNRYTLANPTPYTTYTWQVQYILNNQKIVRSNKAIVNW